MQCLIRVFQTEKSELQQQSSFRLTSRLFVYWGGGGSCIKAGRGLNLLLVLSLLQEVFLWVLRFSPFPKNQHSKFQLSNWNNFLWTVLLSTIEMMSECSKLKRNNELQASCSKRRKEKTNGATITLFSLSVLLLTKGFDQLALEKSLSYCKM